MSAESLGRYYQPTGQLSMSGSDWQSDNDKKAVARREASRKRAGQSCAKKLRAAAEALSEYLNACRACRDGSGDERKGASDGRLLMIGDLSEYAGFLESRYDA